MRAPLKVQCRVVLPISINVVDIRAIEVKLKKSLGHQPMHLQFFSDAIAAKRHSKVPVTCRLKSHKSWADVQRALRVMHYPLHTRNPADGRHFVKAFPSDTWSPYFICHGVKLQPIRGKDSRFQASAEKAHRCGGYAHRGRLA